MIEIKDLEKKYGDHTILNHVNITLHAGNIYVVKGNSGSGKSTLLNILGGLDQNFEGEVDVDGKSLKQMKKKELQGYRQQVGYVFQESLLISELSILENLCIIHNDEHHIRSLANKFNVESLLSKYPNTLSNGQRQRISIIRSLLLHPKILLLDEPSAALDQANAYELANYIQSLKHNNITIIIVTHDHCFNDIADVEFMVHYGEFTKGNSKEEEIHKEVESVQFVEKRNKYDRVLSFRRFRKSQKNIGFLISCTILILIVMLTTSLVPNIGDSVKHYLYKNYPVWTYRIHPSTLEKRNLNENDIEVYPLYRKQFGSIHGFSYLPKESSSLDIPNALMYGSYPEYENDVIVTSEYASKQWGSDIGNCIGETIEIDAQKYRVSAVLTNEENIYNQVINANSNYRDLPSYSVFFSEEAMIKANADVYPDEVLVTYVGKDQNDARMKELLSLSFVSYFYTLLNEWMYTLTFVLKIVYAVLLLVAILIFIFMYFVIQLDLENRRKEIGYLQLFGFTQNRIKNLIVKEYLLKVLPTWIYALISYVSLVALVNIIFIPVKYGLLEVLFYSILLYLYLVLLVVMPLRKYMKTDIKKLIK